MYIVLDTETTGTNTSRDRMTQLAFIVYDNSGNINFKYNEYIKPNKWTIPKEKFFLDNDMSTEKCEMLGVPLNEALMNLQDNLKLVNLVVGHNIAFDKRIIKAEQKRIGITHWLLTNKNSYCTMNNSNKLVCAVSNTGRRKMPNLKETSEYFGIKLKEKSLHNALYDVEICNEIYRQLKK